MRVTICVLLLTLASVSAFAPIHTTNSRTNNNNSASQLYFFGNNKKGTEISSSTKAKKNVVNKKVVPPKKDGKKDPLWKQAARMAVTGSPDGVSLLGKPQYNWVTGKPMSRPKAHDWSASYKKSDASKGKK